MKRNSLLLITIIMIGLMMSCISEEQRKEREAVLRKIQVDDSLKKVKEDSLLTIVKRQKAIKDSLEMIEVVFNHIESQLENAKSINYEQVYRGTVSNVLSEVELFRTHSDVIIKYQDHPNEKVQSAVQELKKYNIKLQVREFPLMRKEYARISDNTLWESNIDVTSNGSTITYIGGTFASNANIKDFQGQLADVLTMLRFKRVQYKWYKYDDEYTYYTLESAKDNEYVY